MTNAKLLFCGFLLGVSALAGCQKIHDLISPVTEAPKAAVAPAATPQPEPVVAPAPTPEVVAPAPVEAAPQKVHKHGMGAAEKAAYAQAWANASVANSALDGHYYKTSSTDRAPDTILTP